MKIDEVDEYASKDGRLPRVYNTNYGKPIQENGMMKTVLYNFRKNWIAILVLFVLFVVSYCKMMGL